MRTKENPNGGTNVVLRVFEKGGIFFPFFFKEPKKNLPQCGKIQASLVRWKLFFGSSQLADKGIFLQNFLTSLDLRPSDHSEGRFFFGNKFYTFVINFTLL